MSISNPRIEVKEAAAGGWFGAREEAQVPARVSGEGRSPPSPASPLDESGSGVWFRRARQAVMDLAIVLAAMVAIPIAAVTISDGANWQSNGNMGNSRAKMLAAEASRQFGVAKDASISPLEAGRLFAGFQPVRNSAEFPTIDVPHPEAAWRALSMGPAMFTDHRGSANSGPNASTILLAVASGFSPDEMTYLRKLATSPIWKSFDRVARAEHMDMIGGIFVTPFGPDAVAMHLPLVSFGSAKEMAYAAVSRAAYQLAVGRRDSAETILRSVISYGFTIADNGPGLIHQLIGRVIVEVGRNALEQFYIVTKDPRAAAVIATRPADVLARLPQPAERPDPRGAAGMEKELLARATNPREMQGIRYFALEQLSFSECTNVRELLLGRSPDVSRAFEQAKRDLARYPSERALIDLIQRTPQSPGVYADGPWGPVRQFLYGASSIGGIVLRNPRLASCAAYATEGRMGF